MSGGESTSPRRQPHVTESEEIEADLEDAESEGEDVVEEEVTKTRKDNVTSGEVVMEHAKTQDR